MHRNLLRSLQFLLQSYHCLLYTSVVSSYPGTPSTEVTEEAAKYDEIYCEWAPNEKVAMEVAFGASLAGKRSFCGMKPVSYTHLDVYKRQLKLYSEDVSFL